MYLFAIVIHLIQTLQPGYIYGCSECTTLKIFDISFSEPPPRNSMFINLVYNEDKIIAFLYIYIYSNLHVYCIQK